MAKFFKRHPVIKTIAAYITVATCADINEQTFISKREKYDTAKTVRIATVSGFVVGPLVYNWIKFIERRFVGTALVTAFKKVITEQIFFAPFALSSFFISTNILEGKKDLLAEWKQKFIPTYKTGLCFWPIAQTINFKFVPALYKTSVYMPGCSFLWMTYLCFVKEKNIKAKDEKSE